MLRNNVKKKWKRKSKKVDMKKIKEIAKEQSLNEKKEPLIVIDGSTDVVFNMRSEKMKVWRGTKTSEMASDHEGRGILRWLISKDFDEEALEIIADQLEESLAI